MNDPTTFLINFSKALEFFSPYVLKNDRKNAKNMCQKKFFPDLRYIMCYATTCKLKITSGKNMYVVHDLKNFSILSRFLNIIVT